MKLTGALLAGALIIASPVKAESTDEIRAANARWTTAVAAKDMAALEAIVAPEFELTSGGATAKEAVPRAAWMANLRRMQISRYETEITDLRVNGNIAVATVKGSWDVALGDRKRSDAFQLRDVWVRRPQGWQVVRRFIVGE